MIKEKRASLSAQSRSQGVFRKGSLATAGSIVATADSISFQRDARVDKFQQNVSQQVAGDEHDRT